METKDIAESTPVIFPNAVFPSISFGLCMIALVFPVRPSKDQIHEYNLWWETLLQILPFMPAFQHDASKLISTRKECVRAVFDLHQHFTGERLVEKDVLQFFSGLRATDCGTEPSSRDSKEQGCVRAHSSLPNTCATLLFLKHRSETENVSTFSVDPELAFPQSSQVDEEWTTDRAFCSCYFAPKWFLLHLVASSYPSLPSSRDKFVRHTFLTLFGRVLACFACRLNFESNLRLTDYNAQKDLESHQSFVDFVFRLHNNVNAMLNKRPHFLDVSELEAFFNALSLSNISRCLVVVAKEDEACGRFYIEN